MKKLKSLIIILSIFLLLPIGVDAKEKINVYLFRRNGCGYCEKALNFFNNLDDEYKAYFNLVEKEVSTSKANATLMKNVAKELNVEVNGVPFIVIGEQNFIGYTETYDDSIKLAIKNAYEDKNNNYKDVVKSLTNDNTDSNDAAITIVILLACVCGVAFLIYMAKDKPEVDSKKKKSVTKKTTTKKTNKK